MWSPAWPIRVSRPTVFRETVFPPVLGPVIIRRSKSSPRRISMGTTFFFGIRGWRAFFRSTRPSSLKTGSLPFISMARPALAKIKSSCTISSRFRAMASRSSAICSLKPARMISISFCSWSSSSRMSLFSFTTAIGSINRVEPVEDWSWIMPGTCPLYSALTGIQYRPFLMVITESWR